MLRMMTYGGPEGANRKLVVTDLTPAQRCISKGVALDINTSSGEEIVDETALADFITRNGGSSLFPDSRLMPVSAILPTYTPEYCYIPADDYIMDMSAYSGDPQGHDLFTGDAFLAGYNYTINTSGILWSSTDHSWLQITQVPYVAGTAGLMANDDGYAITNSILYEVDPQPSGSGVRSAKIPIHATKDTSIWSDVVDRGYTPAPEDIVCSDFVVTVRQLPAADVRPTVIPMASYNSINTLTITSAQGALQSNGANLDFAVISRNTSSGSRYWSKYGVYGQSASVYDNLISVTESNANESVSINIKGFVDELWRPADPADKYGSDSIRIYLYGNWSGANTNSPVGSPLPVVNSAVPMTINGDGSVVNVTRYAKSGGNLNIFDGDLTYATAIEIRSRLTCIAEILVTYNDSDDTYSVAVKDPDAYDTYNYAGIVPVFYPVSVTQGQDTTNFTWHRAEPVDLTDRIYEGIALDKSTTATITMKSVNDLNGNNQFTSYMLKTAPGDSTSYTVTHEGVTDTLTANASVAIRSNTFTISFANVDTSQGVANKLFILELIIPSERMHGQNASPESAQIAFTFNE